jgi:hypothetical protein
MKLIDERTATINYTRDTMKQGKVYQQIDDKNVVIYVVDEGKVVDLCTNELLSLAYDFDIEDRFVELEATLTIKRVTV